MFLILIKLISCVSEKEVEILNNKTYKKLDQLSKTDFFSKVKINFYEKCPKVIEGCAATSCEVPVIKYKNEEALNLCLETLKFFKIKKCNCLHGLAR